MTERHIDALARELPGALQEGAGRAVLLPRSEAELSDAMRIAARVGARFVPPGGAEVEDAIAIDLRRMCDVLAFDDTSHLVHAEAGVTLAELEDELSRRGQTLDLDAPSEEAIGAWLARGAPGARPRGDDPVDQWVAGASAVLPDGRILHVRPAPRRAVGPDLVSALVGARGRLGVITSVHLVTRRRGEELALAFRFDGREDGRAAAAAALAWMRGRGVRPATSYLAGTDGGIVLALRLGGEKALRDARTAVARRCAEERGGVEIDPLDTPARPAPTAPKPSRIVEDLARALDPDHVLG
jgi:alkyldihydroxyacetonephosphate synthase